MRTMILVGATALAAAVALQASAQSGGQGSGQWQGGQGRGQGQGQGGQTQAGQAQGGQVQGSQTQGGQGRGGQSGGQQQQQTQQPANVPAPRNGLTLYENPGFGGRQFTYYSASDQVRLQARSARTVGGPWAVCEGQPGRSQCITVDGAVSNLNIQAAAVQPGQAPAFNGRGQGGWGNGGGNGQGGGYGQGGNGQGGYGQGGQWRQGGGYGPLPQAGQRFQYTCDHNMSLAATFASDGRSVKIHLQGRDQRMTLDRTPSAGRGSFSFADKGMQFSGNGSDATYSERARPSLVCSSAH